jgi:hypothetical protein
MIRGDFQPVLIPVIFTLPARRSTVLMLPSMLFPQAAHFCTLLVVHDGAYFLPAAAAFAYRPDLLDLLVTQAQLFAHALHALGGIAAALAALTFSRFQPPGGTRQQDHAEGESGYALHTSLRLVWHTLILQHNNA